LNKLKNIIPPSGYVRLGKLGKTFQLSGGIRFYGLGVAEQKLIFELEEVFIEDKGDSKIREVREVGANTIVYFSVAKTPEEAKALTNKTVYVSKEKLKHEASFVDIIQNLEVFLDDKPFGSVKELIRSNVDILLVDSPFGEIMLPTNAPYVEITEKDIRLRDLPSGLLELNQ